LYGRTTIDGNYALGFLVQLDVNGDGITDLQKILSDFSLIDFGNYFAIGENNNVAVLTDDEADCANRIDCEEIYTLRFQYVRTGQAIIAAFPNVAPTANLRDDLALETNTIIRDQASIGSLVVLGDFAVIGAETDIKDGVRIGESSMIGFKTKIEDDALIGDNTVIGSESTIKKDADIGDGVTIGDKVEIGENATIEDNVVIGNDVVIKDGVTVPDGTVVPDGTTVE